MNNEIYKQLSQYFNADYYSDTSKVKKRIGVTLTKERILFLNDNNLQIDKIKSITWEDVLFSLDGNGFENDILLKSYKHELMSSNFIKTYEEEVFCPPVGNTYKKVEELGIYCCPSDRSLKDAIYLLPRIPVNGNENILRERYNIKDFKDIKGKGFCIALYKIENSFIVDGESLEAIENIELKNKVSNWLGSPDETLKVFVLSEKMDFESPKFTINQNNAWNGYFSLSQIWSTTISK